jgi:predicted Fe-Mo cluster-binding NifX family protein
MKVAIPVVNGQVARHFGHCAQFALIEVDAEAGTVGESSFLEPPPHEPGALPRWLQQQGADVVIAGGMGRRAQALFSRHGIQVLVGAPSGDPEQIAAQFLADELDLGENICDH